MVKGDETAYRVFYEAYFDRLSRYLLVVTGGREEATRDALSSTLARVVRYIKVFPDEATFWSWLTVLARSSVADESKKRRRYLAFLDRFNQQSTVVDGSSTDAEDERIRSILGRHLDLLPVDDRALVESKYFAHKSVRALAEEHQTSEKAIESRLSRIRRKLRESVLVELKNEPKD